jgi:hypothetical protein
LQESCLGSVGKAIVSTILISKHRLNSGHTR